MRLAPTASYALAQIIVVVIVAYLVSEYGVDLKPEYGPGQLGPFLATTILIVPVGALLGVVDAAARRSSNPLVQVPLLIVDALLIVHFALFWIVPIERIWIVPEPCASDYYCPSDFPDWPEYVPDWPEYIGGLIGAELGLVVLVVVSMTTTRVLSRGAIRVGS